ncbi:Wadjet anti-phage system protein JetD domain-containing protein [Paenibacillus sp. N3.4]|uniref:Wadjet anti-phage system protein JetD domain-containing protein n=1 Tax=Paenibacillus sp. N3.4 TaxID=2603222 RepID=UPI0011C9FAA6|nr:Wadjet anti-phage system protein JetD domain-containing protein [Paenibacillus sp. N3.4]TXK77815.1 hypothetical protein FU659_21600 [Paenibacillus sp. N3.4]
MNPKKHLIDFLHAYKKSTILLSDLEDLFLGQSCTYEDFSAAVLELENEGILQIVKKKGRMVKEPYLAYQYRVHKSQIKGELHQQIHQARSLTHRWIQLDIYYSLSSSIWQQDWPYIQLIDTYLNKHGLPSFPVPAPERSFALVGNEKWITEGQGKELLDRIGLWEKMLVIPVADPLMMAVHPSCLQFPVHRHLIVENKTTYQALLQALPDVPFTTLIFGGGYRITKSIELLPIQLPLPVGKHEFYYFGDIDKEGMSIWHILQGRVQTWFDSPVHLAMPFYRACLAKSFAYGKENQRDNSEAAEAFLRHFSAQEQIQITQCLAAGGYFPQEILHTQELCALWRNTEWTT